jgi:hypothetical protein
VALSRIPAVPDSCRCQVWRIVVGLSLIPAFGTLYQRLTLAEATRFVESQNKNVTLIEREPSPHSDEEAGKKELEGATTAEVVEKKKAHFRGTSGHHQSAHWLTANTEFLIYFGEWRHGKILLGTCLCWFLLDIACVSSPQYHNRIPILSQVLRNQPESERRPATDWLRREHGDPLGEAVQDIYR